MAVLRVHGGSVLSGPGQKTILVHLLVLVLVLVVAGDTLTIYGLAAAGGEAGRVSVLAYLSLPGLGGEVGGDTEPEPGPGAGPRLHHVAAAGVGGVDAGVAGAGGVAAPPPALGVPVLAAWSNIILYFLE